LNDDRLPGAGYLGRNHILLKLPTTLTLHFLQRGLISGEFLADIDAAVLHFEVQETDAEHAPIGWSGVLTDEFLYPLNLRAHVGRPAAAARGLNARPVDQGAKSR
jgi:hypothetical protein